MRKILFHAETFKSFWAHYSFIEDEQFILKLNSLGYELEYSDKNDSTNADYFLFSEVTSIGLYRFGLVRKIKHYLKVKLGRISLSSRDLFKECQEKKLYDKTALIVAEGTLHLPENHVPELGVMFPVVFTWNDNLVDGERFFKYRIPQPLSWPKIELVPFEKKKLLVNISANKYHTHPSELYSVRRKSIRFFEKVYSDQFDLYGIGWNQPANKSQQILKFLCPVYTSYKGTIKNKSEIYPKYRFALCYENAQTPGYITEKIFDCLRSNCVPIYLGAPNVNDYIPHGVFIDRRQFKDDEELAEFLLNIGENEYIKYQENIKQYLSSELFSSFLSTSLAEIIVDIMEKKLRAV